MAWGNFITLPCPYKKWDSNLKNMMLSFLPMVGLVIGVLWMGIYWCMVALEIPVAIAFFVLMFYIFAICGFMHMDGFMDCNDAILSRRPLEERQRILKDSTVGAFAVVTVAFLLIGWYAAMSTAAYKLDYLDLVLLPVISRGIGGLCVLGYMPIGHSQYVHDYEEPNKGKYIIAVILEMLIITALVFLGEGMAVKPLICGAVMVIVGLLACLYARRNLGGMSGDVAGYVICLSEFAGIVTLAII